MNSTEDLIIDEVMTSLRMSLENESIWTPEFLARKFWSFCSGRQAEFFNILANISKYNARNEVVWTEMQWRYMQDDLTSEGKNLIDNIKSHTDKEAA